MHIIILEGDTPQLLRDKAGSGIDMSAARFGQSLQACNASLTFDVTEPYRDDFSIENLRLSDYDGAVFTGSGVSWSTQDQRARPQQKAMEAVFKAGLPTMGSCNGMQLAATVLGGSVTASPNGFEVGIALDIQLTDAGRSHPYHDGRESGFCCPCIHRDEVDRLPPGACITATNAHSQVQAMVYEEDGVRFWGTQYHPEYTLQQMAAVLQKPGTMFQADDPLIPALIKLESGQTPTPEVPVNPLDLTAHQRTTELRNWLNRLTAFKLAS